MEQAALAPEEQRFKAFGLLESKINASSPSSLLLSCLFKKPLV